MYFIRNEKVYHLTPIRKWVTEKVIEFDENYHYDEKYDVVLPEPDSNGDIIVEVYKDSVLEWDEIRFYKKYGDEHIKEILLLRKLNEYVKYMDEHYPIKSGSVWVNKYSIQRVEQFCKENDLKFNYIKNKDLNQIKYIIENMMIPVRIDGPNQYPHENYIRGFCHEIEIMEG